ncbi:MAG: hypothetical protein JNL17_11785 [Cyclobacteriaceae bacterium]|nr:hypothetical protein [Cyclobacteriaceae bacterium]
MNWSTIYITGKAGFEREVQRKLDRADIAVMNGTSGTVSGSCLYWIAESVTLRALKEAIGSDLIWKYRLRFSPVIEQPDTTGDLDFTEREKKLILHMERRSRQPIL